jgi:hypothetical protein
MGISRQSRSKSIKVARAQLHSAPDHAAPSRYARSGCFPVYEHGVCHHGGTNALSVPLSGQSTTASRLYPLRPHRSVASSVYRAATPPGEGGTAPPLPLPLRCAPGDAGGTPPSPRGPAFAGGALAREGLRGSHSNDNVYVCGLICILIRHTVHASHAASSCDAGCMHMLLWYPPTSTSRDPYIRFWCMGGSRHFF